MKLAMSGLAAACLVVVWCAPFACPAEARAGDSVGAETRAEIEARGEAFVEAINAGDDATRKEILARICAASFIERVPLDSIARHAAGVGERLGRLEFHHAELSEWKRGDALSLSLHVYAKSEKSGRWQDLQVRVEPTPPHRLLEMVFIADVSEPVYLPNGEIQQEETRAWLNGYIDRLVEKESLSGAVLLALGDRVMFERYFGFADAARTAPVGPGTRFNLGSGNKMFTALAVMLLERDGLLSLGDPVSKFFPDFPDPGAAERITIAQLLSHTSGISEYWTQENAPAVRAASGPADLLALVYQEGMSGRPGAAYSYSNSNFVMAGFIVEKMSGKPYDELVRERITGPLGLKDTDTFMMDGSVPRLAERLTRAENGGWVAAPGGRRGGAAGGGFSTPRDFFKFSRALVAGKVVPEEVVARMTTSQTPAASRSEADDYGFGFILGKIGNQRWFGHGGIAPGVNFEFRHYPSLDAALITFSNQDNGAYDDLRRTAEKLLTGVR